MYFDDNSKKYVLLDIEGNSLSKEEERKITQFSAIVFENGEKKEVNWFNRNVNLINPYVVKLNDISVNTCKKNGMTEKRLIANIYELLSNCDLIYAYGCDFDKNILKLMFKKYKLPELKTEWVDVIFDVEKYLAPTKKQLSVAASEYGFSSTNYHDALTDCYATLYLMNTIEDIRRLTND